MTYRDASGTTRNMCAFTTGICAYSDHCGDQCEIAKTIKPFNVQMEVNGHKVPRTYAVIETRYGNADLNQALFWRCHEDDRDQKLGHYCPR